MAFQKIITSASQLVLHSKYDAALRCLLACQRARVVALRNARLSIGAPVIDDLLYRIGTAIHASELSATRLSAQRPKPAAGDLYICSQLYEIGGHTRLLKDYIQVSETAPKTVLCTNALGAPAIPKSITDTLTGQGVRVAVAPNGNHEDRTRWLWQQAIQLAPRRIFFFHHDIDVVAATLAHDLAAAEIYIVNHAEFSATAGLCSPAAEVLAITPFRYHLLRHLYGDRVHYLPICSTAARQTSPGFSANGKLRTASSGRPEKFRPAVGAISYPSVVAQLLATTAGQHLHIGPLPSNILQLIHHELDRMAVAREHFIHIPQVDSLSSALVEYEVDLYLQSFPYGGARACIEALSTGTPTIWHTPRQWERGITTHLSYPGALRWRTPRELMELTGALDEPALRAQGAKALAQHQKHHDLKLLAESLNSEETIGGLLPPPLEDPELIHRTLTLALAELAVSAKVDDSLDSLLKAQSRSPQDE